MFRNAPRTGHWLEVVLRGDGKAVNTSAIGSQVRIVVDGRTLVRQVEAGTGEGNHNDLRLHFGLGRAEGRVTLQVTWPNGRKQVVKGVALDKVRTVKYQ